MSDEHEVTRGLSPAVARRNLPRRTKEEIMEEEQHVRKAAFLSSQQPSQQPSSAAFLSSFSQQPFSAALSAAFLSSLSQQLFSATFLGSQQPSQQPSSAAFLSSFFQLPSSAIILLWSGVLWSGVGGQLLPSSCCGLGLVVIFLWPSMNTFFQRNLWLRFREKVLNKMSLMCVDDLWYPTPLVHFLPSLALNPRLFQGRKSAERLPNLLCDACVVQTMVYGKYVPLKPKWQKVRTDLEQVAADAQILASQWKREGFLPSLASFQQ